MAHVVYMTFKQTIQIFTATSC